MNDLEDRLTRHLRDTADLAEPAPNVIAVLHELPGPGIDRPARGRSWVPAAAAAALVVAGGVGLAVLNDSRAPSTANQPSTPAAQSATADHETTTPSTGQSVDTTPDQAAIPTPPITKVEAAAPRSTTSAAGDEPTTSLDPNGPVAVTGIRIGKSDSSNPPPPGHRPDGTIDLEQVPEWIAVGNPANPEGGCVGYVRKADMWSANATPENANAPIVIYNENEQPIGQIANGETTIFES